MIVCWAPPIIDGKPTCRCCEQPLHPNDEGLPGGACSACGFGTHERCRRCIASATLSTI